MAILLFVCLAFVGFSAAVSLPSGIRPCVRSDPAVAECLLREARRMKSWFVAGLPEYGVPTLDPLQLDDFTVLDAGLSTSHTNAQLTGLRDCEVAKFKVNQENKMMEMTLKGTFVFNSNYSLNGQLLLIPVRGQGKSVVELIDTALTTTMAFDLETAVGGLQYMKLGTSKTKGKFGNVKVLMEGLFGDDKLLSNTLNQLINENWRELMKSFGPPTSRVINQQLKKHMQTFLSQLPYDLLFPET